MFVRPPAAVSRVTRGQNSNRPLIKKNNEMSSTPPHLMSSTWSELSTVQCRSRLQSPPRTLASRYVARVCASHASHYVRRFDRSLLRRNRARVLIGDATSLLLITLRTSLLCALLTLCRCDQSRAASLECRPTGRVKKSPRDDGSSSLWFSSLIKESPPLKDFKC